MSCLTKAYKTPHLISFKDLITKLKYPKSSTLYPPIQQKHIKHTSNLKRYECHQCGFKFLRDLSTENPNRRCGK